MTKFVFIASFLIKLTASTPFQQISKQLPDGFVYVRDIIPHIEVDLRYCGHHNFIGKPIQGYLEPQAILTKQAAEALAKVEKELNKNNMGLKIYDGYRPQSAVNHFVNWSKDPKDTLGKAEFYPTEDKHLLFKRGYIASKSGHSRGSTVDLTIIMLDSKIELDMGSPFDFLGEISGHLYTKLSPEQLTNRKILRAAMEKHGFKAYSKEWWHYTLNNEPFKDKYFDFPVQ
ncbi:M15 family metallopeptidase [Sphingobacterium faecale]|uniref:D-alanyl-D-alanine dipeptidase n=1 Tax=Sphingobacterium faecale TaxID=2803775 RepID=A0ABS1R1S6_9SPHI|nr:M15 family metallopeptidase [Sphingobacterium faecale]MBL1408635.1 M15 family metallopeptidase [Sphingobacterium faecale]